MPAIYAHDKFGSLVYTRLTGEIKTIAKAFPLPFRIGLQGPDILFFYHPLKSNPVSKLGFGLHEETGTKFLLHGLPVVAEKGIHSGEYAYLLGFVCHFILDSECHPYVSACIEATGVDHNSIESEFEKYLMRLDGIEPLSYPIGDTVPVDTATAEAIYPFYRGLEAKTVEAALKDMKRVKNLLVCKGEGKRAAILSLMRIAGIYDSLGGIILRKEDNPKCVESNEGLYKRLTEAVPLAVAMLDELHCSVTKGAPLHERFNRNFE